MVWRTGGRLNGHFPVADFDAHRLGRFVVARIFQEAGWSECWCTRTVYPVRTLGGDCDVQQSSCIRDGADKQKPVGGASRWTAVELDGQISFISYLLPHKGNKLGEFECVLMEIQEFVSGRPKQHLFLFGDFNVSLHGLTDYHHVGESIPRHRTLLDTNDSLRARALHTVVAELDLTVTNTWMDADSEQELFTRSVWSDPVEALTEMDFIMSSKKLEMRRVQVLDSDWFKTDHRAVFAVLTLKTKVKYTMRSDANLRGWKADWNVMAPLLLETAKSHRKFESREMSVTARAQIGSAEEEKRWTTTRKDRVELALPSNLEKEETVETRETSEQDQGKCRDGESTQENTMQAFQLEFDCETGKPRKSSHRLPRPLFSPDGPE